MFSRLRHLALLLACVAALPRGASGADALSVTPGRSAGPGLSAVTGPVLETTVASLRISREGKILQVKVSDLDIIVPSDPADTTRLVPVVRIAQALHLAIENADSSLFFRVAGAPDTRLDLRARTVSSPSGTRSARLEVGVSDVTRKPDVYVDEAAIAALLPVSVAWDERTYEYSMAATTDLGVFSPGVRRAALGSLDFLQDAAPAEQSARLAPALDFASVRMRAGLARSREGKLGTESGNPNLQFWSSFLDGVLNGSVTARPGVGRGPEIDRASWTGWLGESEIGLGDQDLGVSELVFPSVPLVGARWNGLWGGSSGDERDPSQMGRRQTFASTQVFEGRAPVGAQVSLLINGNEVGRQTIQTDPSAPPGEGFYRFEAGGLMMSRLNDVRILIQPLEGPVEEIRKEILGVGQLAPGGALAFAGGVGSRAEAGRSAFSGRGRLAAGRFLWGLSSRLSVGGIFARQDAFLPPRTFVIDSTATATLPERSTHTGGRLVWMPFDRLFLTGEAARLMGTAWAGKATGELRLAQNFRLEPEGFWYEPGYSSGQDNALEGLRGSGIGFDWRSRKLQASARSVAVRPLPGARWGLQADVAEAVLALRSVIPGVTLSLQADLVRSPGLPLERTGIADVSLRALRGWTLRSRVFAGDGEDMSVPLNGRRGRLNDVSRRLLQIGSKSSQVRLEHDLGASWTTALEHRWSPSWKRSAFELTRLGFGARTLQFRGGAGYDWLQKQPIFSGKLEFLLDSARRNLLQLEADRMQGGWAARLALDLDCLVSFAGLRPRPAGARVNPDAGGVKGSVFLDLDGDGRRESGEPGVRDVKIASESGSDVTSGPGGGFFIPAESGKRRMRLGLRPDALSAIYTPTTPARQVSIRPGQYTEVDFGLAVLGSVSGRITAVKKAEPEGVRGVRVVLLDPAGQVVGSSITAADGSYYLGEIRPGTYEVGIDQSTLPPKLTLSAKEIRVEVRSQAEPFELGGQDFSGTWDGQETVPQQ